MSAVWADSIIIVSSRTSRKQTIFGVFSVIRLQGGHFLVSCRPEQKYRHFPAHSKLIRRTQFLSEIFVNFLFLVRLKQMQDKVFPYIFWCIYFLAKSDNEKVQKKSECNKIFGELFKTFNWLKMGLTWCYIKNDWFSYFVIISCNKKKHTWGEERNAKGKVKFEFRF